jgi:hypothetical protein
MPPPNQHKWKQAEDKPANGKPSIDPMTRAAPALELILHGSRLEFGVLKVLPG